MRPAPGPLECPDRRVPAGQRSGPGARVRLGFAAGLAYHDSDDEAPAGARHDPRGARQEVPVIIDSVLRAGEGKTLRRLKRIADQVNSIEEDFAALSDAELRALTDEFRQRHADGESLDDLLPEAFATVREAARRTLGQRHFDVQLMGGAALHLGNIAEMRTGEGKTLTSVLPAYLNALTGKGVHVVTVNDYLAKRDSEWMGRVHRFLGLEVGVILAQMPPEERRKAVRGRHHLRHQQRVRLRLPARQHGLGPGRVRAARAQLRHRGRGRLDPHRRGPDAADHQRPGRAERPLVHRVRQDRAPAAPRRGRRGRLRGRREEEDRRHPRVRGGEGRGLARHRQPVRPGQHAAGQLPEQRHQGQGAVQEGQGLRRGQRRGPDRGRVHRPDAARPPVQRGHAPGHRGQGRRADPEREPDAGHDHPAELLPALRQAGRDDRHGDDRGQRVRARSTSSAWCRSRPTSR